jgi:hypothetical protein
VAVNPKPEGRMSNAYTAVAFRNSDPHHHSAGSTRALGNR